MVEKINCLICGNPIAMPLPNIDPGNYEGHIFCHNCNLLLYIKSEASIVKKYKVVSNQTINVTKNVSIEYMQADSKESKSKEKE